MNVYCCDRCGKIIQAYNSPRVMLENTYYIDLCYDCRLWFLHELHAKEEWENAKNGPVH